MSKSLGVLTLDLVTKTSGFVEGLSKAERASAKSKKQFEKDLDSLKRSIGYASVAFVAGATAMIGSSIKIADESRKTAQAVGLTTEALTGLRWAASQSGVSNDELTASFRRFSTSINDASNGIGKGKEVFDELGISIKNTDGTLKDSETLFYQTANALAAMDDGLQKTAFASELLGRSGSKLIPLLNGGEAGIKTLTDEARKLGLVISDETAKNAEIFNDSLAVMGSTARGVANLVVANFIPVMAEMAQSLANADKESGFAAEAADAFTSAIKGAASVVIGAVGYIDTYAKALAGIVFIASQVPEGFDAIKNAVSLVGDELDANLKKYDEYLTRVGNIGTESPVAQETGGTSVGAGGEIDTKAQDKITALEDSFKTELELLQAKHEEENAILAAAREQGLETTQSYDELELMLAQRQADQLKAIDDLRAKQKLDIYRSMFSNLSTLMNTESRKAFEVGKAAALAGAIVDGYAAAVSSYDKGAEIGGPVLGAAFAATSLAATGAQIQAINSTKFGGGGGGAGNGTSNTQAVNNASQPVAQQTSGADRNVFVKGINKGDLYSGEQLLDLINNELSNGGKIIANG